MNSMKIISKNFSVVAEVGSMNFMNKTINSIFSLLAAAAAGSRVESEYISHCLRKQTEFPFKNYDL